MTNMQKKAQILIQKSTFIIYHSLKYAIYNRVFHAHNKMHKLNGAQFHIFPKNSSLNPNVFNLNLITHWQNYTQNYGPLAFKKLATPIN